MQSLFLNRSSSKVISCPVFEVFRFFTVRVILLERQVPVSVILFPGVRGPCLVNLCILIGHKVPVVVCKCFFVENLARSVAFHAVCLPGQVTRAVILVPFPVVTAGAFLQNSLFNQPLMGVIEIPGDSSFRFPYLRLPVNAVIRISGFITEGVGFADQP